MAAKGIQGVPQPQPQPMNIFNQREREQHKGKISYDEKL